MNRIFMKNGVSLVSLIITIIVIIVLAGITIFSSSNTVDESQKLKKTYEFNEVASFVEDVSAKANAKLIKLKLSGQMPATDAQLASFPTSDDGFTASMQNEISAANQAQDRNANYKYYYVTGSQIQNGKIPGVTIDIDGNPINDPDMNFTFPKKVENDYIINYYTGTVIAKISDEESIVSGYKE